MMPIHPDTRDLGPMTPAVPLPEAAPRAADVDAEEPPPGASWRSFRLGWTGRCPRCAQGTLFYRFLKIRSGCERCGLDFSGYPTDDAPPYFTILVVGHIVVPAMLMLEQWTQPPEWMHAALWIPTTLALTLALLPRIKGAVLAWAWATGTRG